jgi:hypothetical protein
MAWYMAAPPADDPIMASSCRRVIDSAIAS